MLDFVTRHAFLVSLLTVLTAGIAWPATLAPLADRLPQDVVVATVMLAMAVSLEREAIGAAVRRPAGTALAVAINFGLIPPLAWLMARLLPTDLATGLIVASAVPCTIASAAVWTRRARGNEAIAIVVTLVTNLLCFAATPAWIELLLGKPPEADLSFTALAGRLLLTVAIPVAVGQLLRRAQPVADWAHRRRAMLTYYAQLGILAMVLVGAVRCGEQLAALKAEGDGAAIAARIALVMLLAALLHLVAWAAGLKGAAALGLPPSDQIAVAFAGSQKTLMVGLAIAVRFGGLAALPMVAYHIEQLVIDSLLADFWRRRRGTAALVADPPSR